MISSLDLPAPIAIIAGEPYRDLPPDLFIPPDALELLLDSFSGPFDLLLYLIRRQNIDILDIPIASITQQYMQYINLMKEQRLELAADYLVMAAMLAEIKSRLLLPPNLKPEEEIEEDPRLLLVKKLQLYEQFKTAALELDNLPRLERDIFRFSLPVPDLKKELVHPQVELASLVLIMEELLKKQGHFIHHSISREPLSVKERMDTILEKLKQHKILSFNQLFIREEGRKGVVVSFLAILELAKQALIYIIQVDASLGPRIQVFNDD